MSGGDFLINRATEADIEALLRLYQIVYGSSYPIRYGTDPEAAREMILSVHDRWYVTRDPKTQRPIASVIFDIDPEVQLGRVIALVVDPECRGSGIASRMIEVGCADVFSEGNLVNSLYTTTRTNSIGVQAIFLKNNFYPLGIFPNSHKLKQYETLTLFARFRAGVLAKRKIVPTIPEDLSGLLEIIEKRYAIATPTQFVGHDRNEKAAGPLLEFEFIEAGEFVKRRFYEKFQEPYDRFYPFHEPNYLMVSKNGDVEIYANFNRKDHYCAIVTINQPIYSLRGRLLSMLEDLKDQGISYIEILLGLEFGRSIEALLDSGFVPSAIYPAMRAGEDGLMEDFVVMSRSLEPLNFRGMSVDESFKPYIDQYLRLWKRQALESLEVVHGGS